MYRTGKSNSVQIKHTMFDFYRHIIWNKTVLYWHKKNKRNAEECSVNTAVLTTILMLQRDVEITEAIIYVYNIKRTLIDASTHKGIEALNIA